MKIGIDKTADRMSIRQEFVKAAMQALIPIGMNEIPNRVRIDWIAGKACEIADATLEHEFKTLGEPVTVHPIREPRDNEIS